MGRRPTRKIDPAALPQAINPDEVRRAKAELTFENQSLLGALFGQFDANLVQVENRLGVFIHARGDRIVIEGPEDAVARARDTLNTMYDRLALGQDLDAGAIESLIAMSNEPTLEGIISGEKEEPPIMIRTRKKTIVPRSASQITYMRALVRDDIVFALGPAGTGKTYIAVAQAVSQLISGSVQRLILSRPAVEAGEKLGFLPGTEKEKVDPYLRPLYDALYDCMPPEQVQRRIDS
ncbi:MAG: PhoH family protein, partial [Pseudomonadota bacterium]